MSIVSNLSSIVNRRTDARPIALARIMIGLNAMILAAEAWLHLSRILSPDVLHLPYVPAVPLLPESLLLPFIAVWVVAAGAFTIGWHTRLSGSALVLVLGYALALDQQAYSNHLYLVILLVLLLTVADSGSRFSVDARNGTTANSVPEWPVLLMKLQLTVVYGYSALAKLNVVFISGAMIATNLRTRGPLAIPESWHTPAFMMPLALITIVLEVFLATAFWSPRWRRTAVVVGIMFHIMIVATMVTNEILGLTGFAIAMFALYVLFCDLTPVWRWIDRLNRTWSEHRLISPSIQQQ